MSKKDNIQQIPQEIETTEVPGVLNSWQPNQSRQTTSQLQERAGTNFSRQTIDNLVRRDQNRLEGVNNRTCIVVNTTDPSLYQELRYRIATDTENGAPIKETVKKVSTRNAESKTYFLGAPWSYDDTVIGQYKRAVSIELHTYAVEGFDGALSPEPPLGAFYKQIYDDHTQETATLIAMEKLGVPLDSISGIASAKNLYVQSNSTVILDINKPQLTTPATESTRSTLPKTPYKEGSLVKEVKKYWSPTYNPCAAKALPNNKTPSPPRARSGQNRTSYEGEGTTRGDFGPRIRPVKGTVQFHKGQDMGYGKAGAGYPIVSVASGEVEYIYINGKTDLAPSEQPRNTKIAIVNVRHDLPEVLSSQGYEVRTRYMHLVRIGSKTPGVRLRAGDRVEAGDVVGFMGGEPGWPGSGNTTGAHLHFEVCVRKKNSNGSYDYDEYKGLKINKFSKFGPVDPLHFNYPKIATFAMDKEKELLAQLPITKVEYDKRIEKEKEKNAADTSTQTQRTVNIAAAKAGI